MTGGFSRIIAERASNVRVVKVGGSLLEWPELASSLRGWLTLQPPAANVVIVGGGTLVEKLRELDRAHRLPPQVAHWLAIRAMSLTATIAVRLLEGVTLATSLDELQVSHDSAPQILDVERFLREDRGSKCALPESWDVTSDSIAARVASVLGASELVLLKSALPAGPASREAWSRLGYVDRCFARAARGLFVRTVNLRHPEFAQIETA